MPVVNIRDGDGNIKQVLDIQPGGGNNVDRSGDLVQGTIEGEFVSDKVTRLKYCAFMDCTKLTKISLPNCTEIDYRSFYNCSKVEELYLPNLTTILNDSNSMFGYMGALKEIGFPKLTTAPSLDNSFANCSSVTKINLPNLGATSIKRSCFANCYALHTLILGGEFKTLESTVAFNNTGNAAEKPFCIYVPDNLVDSYKTATNWSAFADKIKPMSELEE